MAIEDRDAFLIRAEVQRRHKLAAEERQARQARREAAAQARAVRTDATATRTTARNTPGMFSWLRRLAG